MKTEDDDKYCHKWEGEYKEESDDSPPLSDRRTPERSFPTTWAFFILIIVCCLVW